MENLLDDPGVVIALIVGVFAFITAIPTFRRMRSDSKQTEATTADQLVSTAMRQNAELRKEIVSLQKEIVILSKEIIALQTQISRLHRDIVELYETIRRQEKKILGLQE